MQSTITFEKHREEIEGDLKNWADKKSHFLKKGDTKGIHTCNLMLDKYLDSLLVLLRDSKNGKHV